MFIGLSEKSFNQSIGVGATFEDISSKQTMQLLNYSFVETYDLQLRAATTESGVKYYLNKNIHFNAEINEFISLKQQNSRTPGFFGGDLLPPSPPSVSKVPSYADAI